LHFFFCAWVFAEEVAKGVRTPRVPTHGWGTSQTVVVSGSGWEVGEEEEKGG